MTRAAHDESRMTAGQHDVAVNIAELLVGRALGRSDAQGDIVPALGHALAEWQAEPRALDGRDINTEAKALGPRRPDVLETLKRRVAASRTITAGAKELVAGAGQIEPAYRIVISDKGARPVLRSYGIDLPSAIQDSVRVVLDRTPILRGVGDRAIRRPESVDPHDQEWSRHGFGELCERQGVGFHIFETSPVEIEYGRDDDRKRIRFTDFVKLLSHSSKKAQVVAVCQSLLAGGDRFLLLVIFAALEIGRVKPHPKIESQLRVFCIRAMLAMNAAETAHQEAARLSQDASSLTTLSAGERRRLESLVARTSSRSGRTDMAVDLFADIFARSPGDAAAFRELLSAVFARDPRLTLALCHVAVGGDLELRVADWIFIADLFRAYGKPEFSMPILQRLTRQSQASDAFVGLATTALDLGNDAMWRGAMERYFLAHNVPLRYVAGSAIRPFGFEAVDAPKVGEHPLVSIVMTTFNASATIEPAVRSVLAQTCGNIELIIVDDDSDDGTQHVIKRLADGDDRITAILKESNDGTYLSKNFGIRQADGEFVTFHDSDDWMHPLRIEMHLEAMTSGAACSTSRWLRMDQDGRSIVRRGGPYTHLNPASTFFRRATFDAVGVFDGVRTGADAEILARVRASLGSASVQELWRCLGIGLHHEKSLTQSGVTAFDEYRYSAVRLAYSESWLRWHLVCVADGYSLWNEGTGPPAFAVPDVIKP